MFFQFITLYLQEHKGLLTSASFLSTNSVVICVLALIIWPIPGTFLEVTLIDFYTLSYESLYKPDTIKAIL